MTKTANEHLERILETTEVSLPLEVQLLGSIGCVLAQDVTVYDDGIAQVLLARGMVIQPRHIALIAAAGLSRVWVHPKPRVVIVTVGDDLGEPGEGDFRPDVNGLALTAAATAAGAAAYRVGPLRSDADTVRSALEDQLVRADIILTACGMSAPDYELLTNVLIDSATMEFSRVAISPGSAQGFGTMGPDSTPVFVLPANPAGALLSFELFVRPLIRRLMGHIMLTHRTFEATLNDDLNQSPDEVTYVRAYVSPIQGVMTVTSVEHNKSKPAVTLGIADSLIIVPAGTGTLRKGTKVDVIRLDGERD